jgi:hypothetical protein
MHPVTFIIKTSKGETEEKKFSMPFIPMPIGTKVTFTKDPRVFYVDSLECETIDYGTTGSAPSKASQRFIVNVSEEREVPVEMSFNGESRPGDE